jgi:PTS system ascorbate-specific IIC component
MDTFNKVLDVIINQVLRDPAIFIGLVVMLGAILRKMSGKDVLVSTIKTVVGMRILQAGAAVFVDASKPIVSMIMSRFNIQGGIGDPWAGVGEAFERMDPSVIGQVGLVMIAAWLLSLVLARITPLKSVYLTGHIAFQDAVLSLWGVYFITGWTDWRVVVLPVVLCAIHWWLGPALIRPMLKPLVGEDPLTLGHNMVWGGILGMWIGKLVGDPKQSAEDLKLPGWLSILKDSVLAYSLIMGIIYMGIGILVGPATVAEFSASFYILYAFLQGLQVAVGVTILLLGVRMFLAELIPAFQGIADKIIPGACAAVDNPVFWPYAPISGLLGLIVRPIGMILGALLLIAVGSPFVAIPTAIPIFFGGTTMGVFINKHGGVRGIIISGIIMGFIWSLGSAWYMSTVGFEVAAGGNIDYALFWPANTYFRVDPKEGF